PRLWHRLHRAGQPDPAGDSCGTGVRTVAGGSAALGRGLGSPAGFDVLGLAVGQLLDRLLTESDLFRPHALLAGIFGAFLPCHGGYSWGPGSRAERTLPGSSTMITDGELPRSASVYGGKVRSFTARRCRPWCTTPTPTSPIRSVTGIPLD